MYKGYSRGQIHAATQLVQLLLSRGYLLSVHDGEEWACTQSSVEAQVLDAIGNTEIDSIKVRLANKEYIGTFILIWGNAPDGTELVADHTDTPVMEEIWETWSQAQEQWVGSLVL